MSHRVKSAVAFLFVLSGSTPGLVSAQIEEGQIPLQTAMSELFLFREGHTETFNQKDIPGVVARYDTAAIVIMPNGTVLKGRTAVAQSLADAGALPHLVIQSDTVRVFGNTAVDVGTVKTHPADGGELVARYIVVLRRGYSEWKLVYAAQTPVL